MGFFGVRRALFNHAGRTGSRKTKRICTLPRSAAGSATGETCSREILKMETCFGNVFVKTKREYKIYDYAILIALGNH